VAAAIGLIATASLSRLVENRMFGVEPLHPGMYLITCAVLATVALAATVQPARRATRVNPVEMLRHE
jgi:ABC-type lipoprotein release transport system permease subunit